MQSRGIERFDRRARTPCIPDGDDARRMDSCSNIVKVPLHLRFSRMVRCGMSILTRNAARRMRRWWCFARSRPGQLFVRRVAARVDPLLYRTTGGRFATSMGTVVTAPPIPSSTPACSRSASGSTPDGATIAPRRIRSVVRSRSSGSNRASASWGQSRTERYGRAVSGSNSRFVDLGGQGEGPPVRAFGRVPPAGFEPAAFCSGGRRSIP